MTLVRKALRQLMLENKEFLKSLYLSDSSMQTETIIENATYLQLKCLSNVLAFIAKGLIPIAKHKFSEMEKNKKALVFFHENFTENLEELKDLVPHILPLSGILPHLLYSLFHRLK